MRDIHRKRVLAGIAAVGVAAVAVGTLSACSSNSAPSPETSTTTSSTSRDAASAHSVVRIQNGFNFPVTIQVPAADTTWGYNDRPNQPAPKGFDNVTMRAHGSYEVPLYVPGPGSSFTLAFSTRGGNGVNAQKLVQVPLEYSNGGFTTDPETCEWGQAFQIKTDSGNQRGDIAGQCGRGRTIIQLLEDESYQ